MEALLAHLLEYRDLGYLVIIISLMIYLRIALYFKDRPVCTYHHTQVATLAYLVRYQSWTSNQLIKLCRRMDVDPDPLPDALQAEDIERRSTPR